MSVQAANHGLCHLCRSQPFLPPIGIQAFPFAPEVVHAADTILRIITQNHTSFLGVHLRIESDWIRRLEGGTTKKVGMVSLHSLHTGMSVPSTWHLLQAVLDLKNLPMQNPIGAYVNTMNAANFTSTAAVYFASGIFEYDEDAGARQRHEGAIVCWDAGLGCTAVQFQGPVGCSRLELKTESSCPT